jgi:hypothetical protein
MICVDQRWQLDWYHADEHVSAAARTLYGEGTPINARWGHGGPSPTSPGI